MKIALVCPASLPATQFGGIMFLSLDIAKELSKNGHEVTIFTTDMDFANNAKTFNKKLPRKEKIQDFFINRSHVWFSIQLFFINPGIYFQMKKEKFDVIHTIGIRSFQSFIAAIIARKKNIPLVISDQGGLTTHPELKSNSTKRILSKIQQPLIKFIINTSRKISVPNDYEKKIFEQFCESSKIVTIRNGINLDIMNFKNFDFKKKYNIKTNFILFLGRFTKIKGIDLLLNAIGLIKDMPEFEKIILVIMGVDFGFQKIMYRMIDDLKISNKILIITNPAREDVIQAYRESKFLVLPSRWELSPLTHLEAFAFRKAVISTDVHGIPYTMKHNEHGLLIKPNAKFLGEAIIELLNNEKMCDNFGQAGFDLVMNTCNSTKMAENTLKLYKELVNE